MSYEQFEEIADEDLEEASGGCGWRGCRPCCGGGGGFAYPVGIPMGYPAAPGYNLGTAIPGAPVYGAPPPVAYGVPAYGYAGPRWKGWRW